MGGGGGLETAAERKNTASLAIERVPFLLERVPFLPERKSWASADSLRINALPTIERVL